MILEIIEGPERGRREILREGETVSLGRTGIAMRTFAEDAGMSALHLVLSLNAGTLRMRNHSQTNGTLVNGQRVEAAVLQSGDTIGAGGTLFRVIGPPPSPYPAQVRVGGWGFNIVPEGWVAMEGVGLVREDGAEFRVSATGVEDALPEGKTLREYLDAQAQVAKSQLKEPEIREPAEARMEGSEEALLLTLSSEAQDGLRVTQRQIYARSGGVVGILTLSGLAAANQDFIEIVRGASFSRPPVEA